MNRISFLNRGYAFKGLLAVKGCSQKGLRMLMLRESVFFKIVQSGMHM